MPDASFEVDPEEMRAAAAVLRELHESAGSIIEGARMDAFRQDWDGGLASLATGGVIKNFDKAVEVVDGHFNDHVEGLIQTSHVYETADDDAHEAVATFFKGRAIK